MKIDILASLKKCTLFSSLDDPSLRRLLDKFKKIHLSPGEILFRQGDLNHNLYLLVTGNIDLYLTKEDQVEIPIKLVQKGESFGELSAISGEPRSISARAKEHSILLMMPGKTFRDLCQEHTNTALNTFHSLANRSSTILELFPPKNPEGKNAVLIPATPSLDLENFHKQLFSAIQHLKHITLISDYDPELRSQYSKLDQLEKRITQLEQESDTTIYLLESHETPLAQLIMKKVSCLYLIGKACNKPDLHQTLQENILNHKGPLHLILLQESAPFFSNTNQWMKLAKFNLHHHVKIAEKQDFQRLSRFLTGSANGVVLGGGGLRSWAHIGALEAILEAGIPIDMIGGTSAGAIVAAHYILHGINKIHQKGLRELSEITRKIISFKNLTWPTLSLFKTHEYVEKQKTLFKDIRIEDLPLPCFFVSCNLSKNTEVIHQNGSLWEAITSSTAVPAIFPPLAVQGELHVDGGILNNLPVDIMRKQLGAHGKIIAVELTRYHQDTKKYHFPSDLSSWENWASKLGLSDKKYEIPSFIEVFLNALLAGSAFKQEMNSQQADLLISPNLSQFGLLNVSQKDEDMLIQIGKSSAKEKMANLLNSPKTE